MGLLLLGQIRPAVGNPAEAAKLLQRAISICSGDSQAHFLLGDALLGRHEDAVASYDRAIAIPPNIVDLHLNRGAALMP